MAITAAMVKELREMTGAGMMECKKALTEAEGDMDKAVDVLRTRGLAAVAKKAGRATNEGTVMALVSEDGKTGAVVELNCETDFVGMNEKFKAYAEKIARAAIGAKPADMDALKAAEVDGETVEAVITDCIQDRRSGCLRRRWHRRDLRRVQAVRPRRCYAGGRRFPDRR